MPSEHDWRRAGSRAAAAEGRVTNSHGGAFAVPPRGPEPTGAIKLSLAPRSPRSVRRSRHGRRNDRQVAIATRVIPASRSLTEPRSWEFVSTRRSRAAPLAAPSAATLHVAAKGRSRRSGGAKIARCARLGLGRRERHSAASMPTRRGASMRHRIADAVEQPTPESRAARLSIRQSYAPRRSTGLCAPRSSVTKSKACDDNIEARTRAIAGQRTPLRSRPSSLCEKNQRPRGEEIVDHRALSKIGNPHALLRGASGLR